ncbi:hypothetical protein CR513_46602, partial [Mucuna pruriens]
MTKWEGYVNGRNKPTLIGYHGGILVASFVLDIGEFVISNYYNQFGILFEQGYAYVFVQIGQQCHKFRRNSLLPYPSWRFLI